MTCQSRSRAGASRLRTGPAPPVADVAPLRFIHAADLHLQSPFVGLRSQLPDAIAREMGEAPFGAWDEIVDLAIRESVEAVLVAGDAYDDAERSLRAQHRFVAGLGRLDAAGIATHVICGNHDPLDGWDAGLEFPAGCRRYGPRSGGRPRWSPAARTGRPFTASRSSTSTAREIWPASFPAPLAASWPSALLHCAVGCRTRRGPVRSLLVDRPARPRIRLLGRSATCTGVGYCWTKTRWRSTPVARRDCAGARPGPRGCTWSRLNGPARWASSSWPPTACAWKS